MMRIEFSREIWYKDFTFEHNFPERLNLAYIDLSIFTKDSLILNLMQIIRIKYFYLNPYCLLFNQVLSDHFIHDESL